MRDRCCLRGNRNRVFNNEPLKILPNRLARRGMVDKNVPGKFDGGEQKAKGPRDTSAASPSNPSAYPPSTKGIV